MCKKGCIGIESAPSICLKRHCEFAEIFSDKMFCTKFAEWFELTLTPVDCTHVCTSDCEWVTFNDDDLSVECAKYGIPIALGDICRDENDLFTPIKSEHSDQKVKADYGKAKLSLVPRRILWDVAAIREYGNNKYPDGGPDNWKHVDVTRYRDAAFRHFLLYLDDPHGVDEESGLPHLWHLACNVAFLCELEDDHIKEEKLNG